MDPKLLFTTCVDQSSEVIRIVKSSQFGWDTPDTEWTVKDLINHMLYELSWASDILNGKTIAEVGKKYDGDLVGDSLQKNWSAAEIRAKDALRRVSLEQKIHLSYGDFPAEHYIRQEANDQLIHAWDLGTAIGIKIIFDPAVAEDLYKSTLPNKTRLAASGLFAPPVPVPESANTQTKLLALLGRKST